MRYLGATSSNETSPRPSSEQSGFMGGKGWLVPVIGFGLMAAWALVSEVWPNLRRRRR